MLITKLTLISITVIGLLTTYTDIKFGKIKNNLIIGGLLIAILLNSIALLETGSIQVITHTFMNIFFVVLISFLLYTIGLLPAGDGKLLVMYVAMIPVTIYQYYYISFFLGLAVLINTFVPAAIVIILKSFFTLSKDEWKFIITTNLTPKNLIPLAIIVFGFVNFLIAIVKDVLDIKMHGMLLVIMLFILMEIARRITPNFLQLVVILSVIEIITLHNLVLSTNFWVRFFYILISITILTIVFMSVNMVSARYIKIEDLKPGMKLNEMLIKTGNTYRKTPIMIRFLYDLLELGRISLSGGITVLTEEVIEDLKKLRRKNKLDFEYLRVSTTIPLAPFAFLGALTTCVLEGNSIVHYLLLILQNRF